MRHNFTDKKTPKPQPDTTLTDHPVRTELPKSAGQTVTSRARQKVVRAPCKKETGTTERGRGSPSTRTPPMSEMSNPTFILSIILSSNSLRGSLAEKARIILLQSFASSNSITKKAPEGFFFPPFQFLAPSCARSWHSMRQCHRQPRSDLLSIYSE